MKPKRNIYIKDHKVLPTEKMTGKILVPYTGKLVLGCEEFPDDFDDDLDWWIICDCDLGEIAGFEHIIT